MYKVISALLIISIFTTAGVVGEADFVDDVKDVSINIHMKINIILKNLLKSDL